jgi:regulator of RNase E activity RraA
MTDKRSQIIERCLKLYVPALSDGADEVGLGRVCMDRGIKPMTVKQKMVGFARPGKMVRSPVGRPYDEAQLDQFMSLATKAKTNDLIVIDMSDAKIGLPLGIRGAVVDGTVRDIETIDRTDFVVFARGRHPATMRGRMDMESIGEPILCGGVTVRPGDLVFGDGDGVVVVSQDSIDEVLAAAEEIVDTDDWWAEKLDEGEDPHELHKERPIP